MIYLSQQDIERFGDSILMDYAQMIPQSFCFPLNIEAFALKYLGLRVEYTKLSEDGSVLGLTTYKGMTVDLPLVDSDSEITVPEDTIFLDISLKESINAARMRFTIAHECAHQLFARIEEKQAGCSFRKSLPLGRRCTCADIKSAEGRGESQANSLAAVLLVPRSVLAPHLTNLRGTYNLISYGGYFNPTDYKKLRELAGMFQVSLSTMKHRLSETGYIINRPKSEYCSLDIIAR